MAKAQPLRRHSLRHSGGPPLVLAVILSGFASPSAFGEGAPCGGRSSQCPGEPVRVVVASDPVVVQLPNGTRYVELTLKNSTSQPVTAWEVELLVPDPGGGSEPLRIGRDAYVEYEGLAPAQGGVIPAERQITVQLPVRRSGDPLDASFAVRAAVTCALFLDGSSVGDSRTRDFWIERRLTTRREWAEVLQTLEKASAAAATGQRRLVDVLGVLDAHGPEAVGIGSGAVRIVKNALENAVAHPTAMDPDTVFAGLRDRARRELTAVSRHCPGGQ
jgi:hypothetical protein